MKKRIMTVILSIFLIVCLTISAAAASAESVTAASTLNKLGLFSGTGTDADGKPIFDLDRSPTRQEAMVMLIRLLGLEKTAQSQKNEHPFTDVSGWADPYIGYAYKNGLTKGIAPDKFGGNDSATETQYIVFLLRALGYSDQSGDFTYADAAAKAAEIGLLPQNHVANSNFTRGDITVLSYSALMLKPKGKTSSLANELLWKDVYTTHQLDSTHDGKLMVAADMPDLISNGVDVYNLNDLHDLILLTMKNNQITTAINVMGYTKDQILPVYNDIMNQYHPKAVLYPSATSWDNYICTNINLSDYLMMEYYYQNPTRYQKSYQFYRKDLISYTDSYISLAEWAEKIDGIIKQQITPGMTQKEKVKKLHDWLVLHTTYDKSTANGIMSPHFAEQVIFSGRGVCDGYAEAFKILINGAGIECKAMYGNTPYGLHAWDQVKIDNAWYNIDPTWDDPDNGTVSYQFFCISDTVFSRDHQPEARCHAEVCPNSLG